MIQNKYFYKPFQILKYIFNFKKDFCPISRAYKKKYKKELIKLDYMHKEIKITR